MEQSTTVQNAPILSLQGVSVRYMTGDFKEIGIKENSYGRNVDTY